jgi:CRISPR/Cas system endoribonuclease Cas6 (RAMP superfamily)
MKFNKPLNSTFHRKFSKINPKEFEINTKHYIKNQFKELFESLLMSKTNLGDSWYIEYKIKGEDESRY